ncbi:MAG: NADH-quinone oxidoreductase subunit NuoE [Bacteroidetes bacterium]|jgi:NADH-quinone oxidoreductase E subunit|nr:NADH-quinone oxidoreductase subunit NuoE [Bacteroidota bacterium]MCL5034068.1 NADH-quinone oxidoreductase subunit NuoE [Bacteroidota bacterium]
MFTEENLRKVEEIRKRYPKPMAALLPVLWVAQEQFGWISEDVMHYIADLLGLPFNHVLGVVTFYTMYNRKPVGKYHIQVCANVSCMLRGSDNLIEHIEHRLGVKVGETTSDKMFTLSEVECLGSCGTAPMMQVNNDYYDNLTAEKIDNLLEEFKRQANH